MPEYVPAKGDLVGVSLDPQAGHEQKSARPSKSVADIFQASQSDRALASSRKACGDSPVCFLKACAK